MKSLELGADIITAPLKILKEWADKQFSMSDLKPVSYQEISLTKPWQEYSIHHDLTDKGIEKFAADWNGLIE
jgi:transaldolase